MLLCLSVVLCCLAFFLSISWMVKYMCIHIVRLSCNYIYMYILPVSDVEKVKENSCLNEKVCVFGAGLEHGVHKHLH